MVIVDLFKRIFIPEKTSVELSPFQERLKKSRRAIRSLKARADAKRTTTEKVADIMTAVGGSFSFLILNLIWFLYWIILNTHAVPGIEPFDPFPFSLLTMIVSLEAIILAIFVLISQNREQKINHLREEIDLEIDLVAESELTKVMELVVAIAKKSGIDLSKDMEIKEMLKPLNRDKIQTSLEKEIL